MTAPARLLVLTTPVAAGLFLLAGCDSPSAPAAPAPSVDSGPAVEARSPDPAPPERVHDTTFDDLKFEMEKGAPFFRSMLTSSIEELDGKRIRIRGYILPGFQQSGLTQFVLVRDNMECCFGPGAALFDCILVEMQPGRTTDFSVRPVAVEGTFSIREFRGPGGSHLAIYHLAGEAVR